MRLSRLAFWLFVSLCLASCGGGDTADAGGDLGPGDAAARDTGAVDMGAGLCHGDLDCDDGVFCNGVSHCTPGDGSADARGCTPMGASPCAAGQTCNEAARMCLSDCDLHGDADGDGHRATTCGGDDCDDADPLRYPSNPELCDAAGRDEDCDAATYGPDRDGDGFVATTCCNRQASGALACGSDCDDTTMDVSPTAPEVCDGVDDNCDGRIDEGVLFTFFHDLDGDGFGDSTMTRMGCSAPTGYVLSGGDCDDAHVGVHPGAAETCNAIDDDCDGMTDPGCSCTAGPPVACGASDGMSGFLMVGACHPGTQSCVAGTLGPCVGAITPLTESCNGVDDNCNGATDEGVTNTYYRDVDGDGYGATSMTMTACGAPAGYAPVPNDCNDMRASTYPGAPETCNAMDDNCDGMVDEGVTTTFYRDADGDGYGSPTSTIAACSTPAGYVATSGDCNDANATVHPGAADLCDLVDNNCDGTVDPGCTCTSGTMQMCGTSDGMGGLLTRGICHPGMQTCVAGAWGTCMGSVGPVPETCNGLDDNCNGAIDDGAMTNFYRDCDRDGFGATGTMPSPGCMMPSTPPTGCTGTGLWATNNGDCNDVVPTTHTSATETCNNVDDDCDTVVDGAAVVAYCSSTALPPHASAGTCVSATMTCVPTTCTAPYLDCVTGAADGCETNGSTARTNCGTCGHVCTWSCGASGCDDAVEVSAGSEHTCARRMSGAVSCWGGNSSGELGDGTMTDRLTPVAVSGLTDAVEISAGQQHTCARRATGAVVCWGAGGFGALGDGTATDRATPVTVSGLTDAVEISTNANSSCARRATGGVVCWGYNNTGQLGNGGIGLGSNTPVAVSGLTDAVELAGGASHTCARRATGTVVCWGWNIFGSIGDGTTTDALAPVAVSGLSSVAGIAAGYEQSCARLGTGSLWCWGANNAGQLGDGATHSTCIGPTDCALAPVAVGGGLSDATELAIGNGHVCARRSSGAIACWGEGSSGQLGYGSTARLTYPSVPVSGVTDATHVTAGNAHACAISTSASVLCWGDNGEGALGDGTTVGRTTPTPVTPPP